MTTYRPDHHRRHGPTPTAPTAGRDRAPSRPLRPPPRPLRPSRRREAVARRAPGAWRAPAAVAVATYVAVVARARRHRLADRAHLARRAGAELGRDPEPQRVAVAHLGVGGRELGRHLGGQHPPGGRRHGRGHGRARGPAALARPALHPAGARPRAVDLPHRQLRRRPRPARRRPARRPARHPQLPVGPRGRHLRAVVRHRRAARRGPVALAVADPRPGRWRPCPC